MTIYDGRKHFHQWDLNPKVTSDQFEVGDIVQFFNNRFTKSLDVKAYMLDGKVVADVPNIMLQTTNPIKVYKYIYDDAGGRTVHEHIFTVEQRPQPSDYFYTETELYELRNDIYTKIEDVDAAIERLDAGLSDTNEAVKSVEEVIDRVTKTEETVAKNESDRVQSEINRHLAETDRDIRENTRIENEADRVTAETSRHQAEQERIAAEEIRQANFEALPNNIGNALKGYASGEVIRVDDVSPIEHIVKAKIGRGRNLIQCPYQDGSKTSNGVTFMVNEDGSITINGTAEGNTAFTILSDGYIPVKGTYTLSGLTGGSQPTYYMQPYVNGIAQKIVTDRNLSYQWDGVVTRIVIFTLQGSVFNNLVVRPQLEEGTTATEYEPYINPTTVTVTRYGTDETDNPQTYVPSADGTCEIEALSPVMTLVTDNPKVTIDLEYNQDSNAVIKKLTDAIVALGGTI